MTSRYDPFEQMNRFLEQTRRSMRAEPMWTSRVRAFPADTGAESDSQWAAFDANVGMEETDEGYVVMADLPGFEKEDLDIRFADGVVTIRGETTRSEAAESHSQWRSRRVHEQVSVPGTVLADEVSASYHNGVLEITLPTTEDDEDGDHRIDIE